MSDSGASIWENSGCKQGPPGLEGDKDTWSAAPYHVNDLDPGNQQAQPAAREPGDGTSTYS